MALKKYGGWLNKPLKIPQGIYIMVIALEPRLLLTNPIK